MDDVDDAHMVGPSDGPACRLTVPPPDRGRHHVGDGAGCDLSRVVIDQLVDRVARLERLLETLEAELVPRHRGRRCPRCRELSLTVTATRPHPDYGHEGIEQHDVRCSCGYASSRLYDPRDYLR